MLLRNSSSSFDPEKRFDSFSDRLRRGAAPLTAAARIQSQLPSGPMKNQSDGRREIKRSDLVTQSLEIARHAHSHRGVENMLGDFDQAVEHRAAAGEHYAAGQLPVESRLPNLVLDMGEDLLGAGFEDVAQDLARNRARRASSDARHFDQFGRLFRVEQ